jgi:hypothetical protein
VVLAAAVVVVAAGSAVVAAGVSIDEAFAVQAQRGKNMKRHGWFYTATFLFGLLSFDLADTAAAQQPSQAQADAIRQSCRSDYQSYCASVPTGGRASLQCLQEHLVELSPPCQTAVSATSGGASARPSAGASQAAPPPGAPPAMSMRDEAALMRRSCGGDFRAYCQGVRPGGGRGLACLTENESRLSTSCRGALAEARGGR